MSDDIVKDITMAVASTLQEAALSLEKAKELVAIAEKEARTIHVSMVISVVDASGHLIILHRMDGALTASIDISQCKAYTAAIYRSSTEELAKAVLPGESLYTLQYTHVGKSCFLGGGIPIISFGTCIGAIGISGGTIEEDVLVANATIQSLI